MLNIDPDILIRVIETIPFVATLGLMATLLLGLAMGDPRKFCSWQAFYEEYLEFGGYFPALVGAINGIAWGVLVETSLIIGLYIGAVFVDSFGRQEFLELSAPFIVFGGFIAYWQYLECQANIRSAEWYRGF
jgi:hypothetical protein